MNSRALRTATVAALLLSSFSVMAQSKDIVVDPKGEVPYAIDQRNVVVKSGADLCWRTGSWTPAAAGTATAGDLPVGCQCDKDVVGEEKCTPPAAKGAAPAPAAVVAVPVIAPPKKCDFSVTINTDQTFQFDKAVLGPIAKKTLDEVVNEKLAACAEVTTVIVTGHTDRLGSQGYNQKLSEKRADAVRSYLVGKGVKADVIETMGAGKTQPVKSCDDKLGRKKLIECLAPNRRVTVDVKGPAK